jgi:hypothetical protein
MNIVNALVTNGLLKESQAKVYQDALQEAAGKDKILTQAEFKNANEAFSKTDAFTGLSDADQESFKKKLDADTLWEKQGASSVTTYDGMEKQIAYYEKLLNDPSANKDKDGNPIVTKEQLAYAKKNGFGNIDGKNGIDGRELDVADIDGDKTNGDITGDGKVDASDRGIDFRSDETASGTSTGGFDIAKLMAFVQQLIKIWAPGVQMPDMTAMPTQKA